MTDRPPPASGRPTPVRVGAPRPAAPPEPPTPRTTWTTAAGASWTVEVAGRSRTGGRGSSGATLLLLVFRPADDEAGASNAGGEAQEALEALVVAEALDDLSPDRLDGLLSVARPHAARPDPDPDFFEGTRRGRRG